MIPLLGPFAVIWTGACMVVKQVGDWLWEKKLVHSHTVFGVRLHHWYVYFSVPAFVVAGLLV